MQLHIQPAHVDQVMAGRFGEMVIIDGDVGGVVADLKAIDPGLGVRFNPQGQCFHVYHQSEDQRTTYLVSTVQAHLTASGTWAGLDQRVVKHIRSIDGWGGEYDYAAEIDKMNQKAERERRQAFREHMGELGELAAHAIRKDRGTRYKNRSFVPKNIPRDAA